MEESILVMGCYYSANEEYKEKMFLESGVFKFFPHSTLCYSPNARTLCVVDKLKDFLKPDCESQRAEFIPWTMNVIETFKTRG